MTHYVGECQRLQTRRVNALDALRLLRNVQQQHQELIFAAAQTSKLTGEEVDARDAFKLLRRVMLPPQWLPEDSQPLEVAAVRQAKVWAIMGFCTGVVGFKREVPPKTSDLCLQYMVEHGQAAVRKAEVVYMLIWQLLGGRGTLSMRPWRSAINACTRLHATPSLLQVCVRSLT